MEVLKFMYIRTMGYNKFCFVKVLTGRNIRIYAGQCKGKNEQEDLETILKSGQVYSLSEFEQLMKDFLN